MSETELERIVVRLVGDGSEFQQMLNTAVKKTEEAARHVQRVAEKIEGFSSSLKNFAMGALNALSLLGVSITFKGAFDQFAKFEEAQIRFRNTVRATGQDVGATVDRFKRLAEEISNVTLVTKGEVFQLGQRAIMMGLNADQAENVIKTSVALAGATGQSAESMLRAAAAMQRGNYQLAQRMIMGRGVKLTEEELRRVVTNMTNAGWQTQIEFANTAAGRLERLGRSLKSFSMEMGGLLTELAMPFIKILQQLTEQIKSMDAASKTVAAKVLAITIAFVSFRPIVGILNMILGPMLRLGMAAASLGVLIVKQTISMALWVAYKVVMLAVSAVMTAYTAIVWVLTSGKVAATAAMIAWSAAAAIGKVVTLALAGAVALLNAVLTPLTLIAIPAFILAFIAVAAIVSSVIATITALVGTIGVLVSTLRSLATSEAALSGMGRVFGEWGQILSAIWRGLQTNIPATMTLIRAAFTLLVSQLRDLWPPLWRFIQAGFRAIVDNIGGIFEALGARARMEQFRQRRIAFGLSTTGIDAQIRRQNVITQAWVNRMGEQVNRAANRFRVRDSEATIAARNAVRQAMADIDIAVPTVPGLAGADAMDAVGGKHKEIKTPDAALRYSAEGTNRINEYLSRIGSGAAVDPNTGFLRRIADGVDRMADRDPVEVEEAEIG